MRYRKKAMIIFSSLVTSFLILFSSVFEPVKGEVALKQLHILFRHGERSPTETYPNDPYTNFNWSGGWGHLTNVLLTDESSFANTGRESRHNYHHYADHNPRLIRQDDHQHRFKVNVWAGILGEYVIGPHFLEGNLTGNVYFQFLQNDLPQWQRHISPDDLNSQWFQYDGAPVHSILTRGKLQMYHLGQTIRTNYKNFLPELYFPEDVNITSSFADRCLNSAEVFTAGLFPPTGSQIWNEELLWQPIPIHYLPRSQDTMMAMKAKCEKYDLMFKDVLASPKVQNILSANENMMRYLSENTGMNVDSIGTVELLFNTLEIEKLNNLTVPLWLNDTLMDTMEKLGAQNLALYSETEYMKRMKGGVLLKYIVTSMEKSLEDRKGPILHLYSGHDLTIVHILRALNLVDTIKPSFGASLIFELYSNGEIKIMYRNSWDGIAETKQIYSCSSPCLLGDWKQVLEPVLPLNWAVECKI